MTLRLRLAIFYAVSLLLCGALLLGIAYRVVSASINHYDAAVASEVRHGLAEQRERDLEAGRPPAPPLVARAVPREERQLRQAARTRARRAQRREVTRAFLWALGGLALVAGLAGWLVAGRALRPLRRVTATARKVTEHNLGERIALAGPRDELRELAETIDGMLDRLQAGFETQQRFIGNASHELRTPLALMRAELEAAMGDPSADRARLHEMAEHVALALSRFEALIEALLLLARSEAPLRQPVAIDLAELAEAATDPFLAQIQTRRLNLRWRLAHAQTIGDAALLEALISNLLQNAVRYNEPGGTLAIETKTAGAFALLVVANDGPALAESEVEALFEPFRRGDASRSREAGGAGLGLSITRAIAQTHGGAVEAQARTEGGLRVTVRLRAVRRPDESGSLPAQDRWQRVAGWA